MGVEARTDFVEHSLHSFSALHIHLGTIALCNARRGEACQSRQDPAMLHHRQRRR